VTGASASAGTTSSPGGAVFSTQERILYASAELFRRQGYAATGLKQVIAEAEVPFGSLYHFFPEGKEALGEEVLVFGGRFFLAIYEEVAGGAPDLPTAVGDFFEGAAQTLTETDYEDACPIATVAGEVASTHDRLRIAAAGAFESWLEALARDAERDGVDAETARALALALLAVLEGAFLLSRTLRSTEPMEAGGRAAVALAKAAVAGSRRGKAKAAAAVSERGKATAAAAVSERGKATAAAAVSERGKATAAVSASRSGK
jgi:AcrR family transcriptional regulator